MKNLSLQIRLIISFFFVASVVWLSAAILSWQESREQLDEFFDTYQLRLARQLATARWENLSPASQQRINRLIEDHDDDGEEDDEALGFAVFDSRGEMIFNDNENGNLFTFNPQADGFATEYLGHKRKPWRVVWLKSVDGNYTIAVGQEAEYRDEAALEMVEDTLMPWLAGLLLLMAATVGMVSREFRPLKKITSELAERSPEDLSPLETPNPPQEIRPLLAAINRLFKQIDDTMQRERSFISDAAHELRTPLTALKVQSEVAQLAEDDADTRHHALEKLNVGIERCTRLVEQLLALSRLESAAKFSEAEGPLNWAQLIGDATAAQQEAAQDKDIEINAMLSGSGPAETGRPLLWSLLLRNLLDNALRYSPRGAVIKIALGRKTLSVSNSGVTLDKEDLHRLGERFFRPPGQEQSGSGLGLSIVKRIAALHHCDMQITNDKNCFNVIIRPEK